ncbi:type II toxin-antitoxin system VapC family toxin [Allokutzneria multivorans]|uniref:Ribonuclease VapC n=1 Tax=Allokutzneria multivorans TaxID=1142134 RepID=A0ABP7TK31_9PSEU
MIVLDTNVISEFMRHEPDDGVVRWLDQYPREEVFTTAVTVAELGYGILRLPNGKRKDALSAAMTGLLAEDFADQILPFDLVAAEHYAAITAERERCGRPISMADAQIAAICRTYSAALITRNTKDFVDTGVRVADPWSGSRGGPANRSW